MNGPLCKDDRSRHMPAIGTFKIYAGGEQETAECLACGHPIRRVYIDGDDDRTGGWSTWTAPRYVINELDLVP